MKITIDKKLFEKFPGLHIGILFVKGIDNHGDEKKILRLMEEVEEMIRFEFTPESLINGSSRNAKPKHKLISAWNTAYEDLGFAPQHYQSNLEGMMADILNSKSIPRENKLVDCFRYSALKNIVPITGYDYGIISGNILLGFANGSESFTTKAGVEYPDKGEVIYRDDKGVISRKWNLQESERVKITGETKNALIFIDGLPPISKNNVIRILNDMKELIGMFCGGMCSQYVLSVLNNKIENITSK